MKKSLKYLGVFFAFILVLTGCGKKDPNKMLEDALEKTSKLESVHEKTSIEGSVKIEGVETSFSYATEGDFIQKKDESIQAHMKFNFGVYGFGFQAEAYLDMSKEKLELYGQFMGKWYKLVTPIDKELFEQYEKQVKEQSTEYSAKDILKYTKSVKELKSDKDGYKKLEVVVDKDKINEEFKEEINKAIEESKKVLENAQTVKEEDIKVIEENDTYKSVQDGILSEDITLNVYLKDGYIAYMEYDVISLIDNVINKINIPEDVLEEYKKYDLKLKYVIEYSDFNKVKDIVVPEDAKEKAEDLSEYLKEYSEEILNEVSDMVPVTEINE